MCRWDDDRLCRAVARVATAAFGTAQAWLDGSQEWLFHIAAAGSIALAAVRSSARGWEVAAGPFSGEAGLFRCLGITPQTSPARDHGLAATRASIKRFPVCAINQVPMSLLQAHLAATAPSGDVAVTTRMSGPEARYPGLDRSTGLHSWSARLMSLPYCMAVLARNGDFTVGDLQRVPAGLGDDDLARMQVEASEDHPIGHYTLEVSTGSDQPAVLDGSVRSIGVPSRSELDQAARKIVGSERLELMLGALDDRTAPVSVGDFAALSAGPAT
jgi:2-methylcitrate dehydratase PrpD